MVDFPKNKRVAYETIDKDEISLVRDLDVETHIGLLTIEAPFRSDGGSIPTLAWSLIRVHPLDPRAIRGFIVHDALYGSENCTRKEADDTLYKIIREDGLSWFKAKTIRRSVGLMGWRFFRKNLSQRKLITLQKNVY